jgi:hypothetical protein
MPAMQKPRYGVISYNGANDPTHFDGWYDTEALARAVFDDWREKHPRCLISLIREVPPKG